AWTLTGVVPRARHAVRAMRGHDRGGSIVVMSSVAGLHGTPVLGAYGPTKAAVLQLVQTLALEGAPSRVRANALCPVWTESPMVDAFVEGLGLTKEQGTKRLGRGTPLGGPRGPGGAGGGRGERGAGRRRRAA